MTPPSTVGQAGINIQFGPSGTQFLVPVTVKLPYDPTQIPSGSTPGVWTIEDAPGSSWAFIGGQPSSTPGFFETQTTHFSSCVVGIAPMPKNGNCAWMPIALSSGSAVCLAGRTP